MSDFGPEPEFFPRSYKLKYNKFHELIHKSFKNPFFYFIRYFHIPWILSWSFCFHTFEDKGILILTLAHRVYIRWWDKFSRAISLCKKSDLFCPEPAPPLPGSSSLVLPLALPLNVYVWFFQVNSDNPGIPHEEAVRLAYLLNSYGVNTKLKHIEEPEPLSFDDIHEIVTKLNENPLQAEFAQSPWSPKDLPCRVCGNIGHTSIVCTESPIFEPSLCCICCGKPGHIAFLCPEIHHSPSAIRYPSLEA